MDPAHLINFPTLISNSGEIHIHKRHAVFQGAVPEISFKFAAAHCLAYCCSAADVLPGGRADEESGALRALRVLKALVAHGALANTGTAHRDPQYLEPSHVVQHCT